jgi:branched-chain amino acid transport system permease protein
MAVTVLFAVIGVGLVALRHSSYGRRLTALKDSPAASATLGQSPVALKLSVFMLSAAIAGVGGALMTAQLGSANLDRFDIFLSLQLLMLTVVGGIGYVSGALFGGILFGVAFVALQNTFDKLGVDFPDAEGLFDFLARFTTVLPALIGVSMARNPTGAVEQIVVEFGRLRRAKPVVVAGCAAVTVAYLLARNETISNWWFVVIVGLVILAMPQAAKRLAPTREPAPTGEPAPAGDAVAAVAATSADGRGDVPLELVGVSRPFEPADRERLDRELGLPAGGR